jgi:NAD(P)-dependent dehydrogenase (short-subunit alcohol dehydrogenase family)
MTTDAALAGTVAIVTGSFGKLGPVWVETLAAAGADVVGLDLKGDGAEGLSERARAAGGSFRFEEADVTDRDRLGELAARLDDDGTVPAVLVNSAGIDQPPGEVQTWRVEDIPSDVFRKTLDVNVAGTFNATQAFGALMARAGRGSIVNIGSLYASVAPDPALYDHIEVDPPFLKPPAYGASKAAVVSLTRYFARLWGPHGVRVNALSPGGVAGGQDPEFLRKFCDRVPIRRMAEPGDLTGPLLFLASDASSYVNGHELKVDGGFTA